MVMTRHKIIIYRRSHEFQVSNIGNSRRHVVIRLANRDTTALVDYVCSRFNSLLVYIATKVMIFFNIYLRVSSALDT